MLEKVAYIKGLMQGMKLSDNDPYKELFTNILDVLEDMAAAITDAEDNIAELDEYIQEVDEALCDCEEGVFFEDDEAISIVCPHCGEPIDFDLSDLEECDGDCCCCEGTCGEDEEE